MKTTLKIALIGLCTLLVLVMDLSFLRWIDEAEAIAGVRRRTARRTAVVVGGTAAATTAAATSAANQQAAAAQQQAATATAEAEAAKQQVATAEAEAEAYKQQVAAAQAAAAPAPAPPAGGALPIGTVVNALPSGCTTMTSGDVQYFNCGSNYYRAAFQGSQLVYVTAQP